MQVCVCQFCGFFIFGKWWRRFRRVPYRCYDSACSVFSCSSALGDGRWDSPSRWPL